MERKTPEEIFAPDIFTLHSEELVHYEAALRLSKFYADQEMALILEWLFERFDIDESIPQLLTLYKEQQDGK